MEEAFSSNKAPNMIQTSQIEFSDNGMANQKPITAPKKTTKDMPRSENMDKKKAMRIYHDFAKSEEADF